MALVVALLGMTSVAFASGWSMDIAPQDAVNVVGEKHTTWVTIADGSGNRLVGARVLFEVISGPNLGQASDPFAGECYPNDDCTTDKGGKVSWTYTGDVGPGTDWIWITACFKDKEGNKVCLEGDTSKVWIEPPPSCPEDPGTRTLGFYKTHPKVVGRTLELVGEPEKFDFIMGLLWKNRTVKGKQQILILDRAVTVLGLNVRVFDIGACSLKEFGLGGDLMVKEIRGEAKELIRDIDWKGRDYGQFPLTSSEKEKLTGVYEVIDAINNSNTEVPLPKEYDDVARPAGS